MPTYPRVTDFKPTPEFDADKMGLYTRPDPTGSNTNWIGAGVGAGMGLLGMALGSNSNRRYSKEDFNIDPEGLAKKRYSELTDTNSDFNKTLLGRYMRIGANATPGKDTLMAPIRGAGGGYIGSAAIAVQQAKGLTAKATNDAFEGWTSAVIGNEANASKYLGLEYSRAQYENEQWFKSEQTANADSGDMFAEVSKLGGTLLGMFL